VEEKKKEEKDEAEKKGKQHSEYGSIGPVQKRHESAHCASRPWGSTPEEKGRAKRNPWWVPKKFCYRKPDFTTNPFSHLCLYQSVACQLQLKPYLERYLKLHL